MKCEECGKTMDEKTYREEPNIDEGESGVIEGKVWECPDPCCGGGSVYE